VSPQKIIVGLGNPGIQHENTPHSLGFRVIDRLAAEAKIGCVARESRALTGVIKIDDLEVLLAKPQTYMNLSGDSVKGLLHRYWLNTGDLIVVCDDLALPWGRLRIRARGSSGGHNGLQSIIEALGTSEFIRVRLGIAPERNIDDSAQYVLTPISAEKETTVLEMVCKAQEALKTICQSGVQVAMSKFN